MSVTGLQYRHKMLEVIVVNGVCGSDEQKKLSFFTILQEQSSILHAYSLRNKFNRNS